MHTALCTFDDRDTAARARDRLVAAGFPRNDIHLQHRGPADSDSMGEDPRAWEGTDREIAASRDVVDRVAGFFVHLFGADDPERRHESWSRAVDSGRTVLVVDTRDEREAQRARDLLHDLQVADLGVYHRPQQHSVQDILGIRAEDEGPDAAGSSLRSREPGGSERNEAARERALAAGRIGEQPPLDLRDPDEERDSRRGVQGGGDKPSR
ncbi:hypothetical protein PE066_01795 [Ramlibacter tataouinensis]|uniref:hypothetical protein n=1 Tax=Ramlibacter tataouinensis TaxID=94132 RepID=UPI0022F3B402|nr:hypothetical protein [Ramlibacter tataouinensis]WBY02287.1 hypothetical protein PE066_01795 [Ramlibacter tataouinensis]